MDWTKIEDFRDDAVGRYEIADQAEVEQEMGELVREDLPPLPDGCDHVWQSGGRWLCE